jgi:PIN domain nuclease of toxin-antitoxin system
MRYLLDTAPWINGVTLPKSLPVHVRRLLENAEKTALCSVSLLEAAILHRLGRFTLQSTLPEFFDVALSSDLQLVELTTAVAAHTNRLPAPFHGDPFDRTIVATAAVMNLTLITTDPAIRDLGACAVEYYPFKPIRSASRS